MKSLKDFRDLKELDIDELKKKREEFLSELLDIRTRFAMKHLDNPMKISKLKHSVARINTLLKEYELGIREIPV
ncbi:MAG: 50S ribosomal protein L29 [Nitrospirota bacterium]